MTLGVRIDSRMPDEAGPGEEKVAIHGVTIFHREIDKDLAKTFSPVPALATMAITVTLLSVLGGSVAVFFAMLQKPSQPIGSQDLS